MEPFVALLICVLVATPILAIAAYVRVRKLAEQMPASTGQPQLTARIYAIEQRVGQIDKTLAELSAARVQTEIRSERISEAPASTTPAPQPAEPTALEAAPPVPTAAATPNPQPPPDSIAHTNAAGWPVTPKLPTSSAGKSSSPLDMENLIAGRWLNRIGITAVLVAVSYFLKYAFDNNWIGPAGRVSIGILLGAAMLPWSHWLLKKGYSYFSEGIAGLGQATLLLSIWAGCHYYTLFSKQVGFVGMAIVTAAMVGIALGRNSERIALLSLFGGFLTPLLVSSGRDEQVVLFTYLLVLGAGLLVIAARRDWQSLAPVSFALTIAYFWAWYGEFYRPDKLERTIIFATLFFVLYAALPFIKAVRMSGLDSIGVLLVLANSFAYLGALYVMLWPDDRWPLTLLALALSAAHVCVARLIPPPRGGESPVARMLFAGLALTFVTLTIPIRLEGKWMTLAFAIEGAILVWSGFRTVTPLLRAAGYFLVTVAALRVLFFEIPAPTFIFNARFATYLVVIACLAAILLFAREHLSELDDTERSVVGIFAVAANGYALVALSLELWDLFGHTPSLGIDRGLAQHLSLSVLWTIYACALILIGVKRHSALLRWQALVLFGLVVTKVFLYDSSYLERFYRIVSFLILGLVLLVVSFLYQRKMAQERTSA